MATRCVVLAAALVVGLLPSSVSAQGVVSRAGSESAVPRLISLAPGVTGILDRLGAGTAIVARAWDDRSEVVDDRPLVGTLLRPDTERMLAARPDIVFLSEFSDPGRLEAVRRAGADLVTIRLERVADVVPAVRSVAAAISRGGAGEVLAAEVQRDVDAVRRRGALAEPMSAVWAIGAQPIMVAGPGGIADDLLTIAGGRNVFADAPSTWFRPSREGLRIRSPDVLIWPVGGDLPPLADLPATSPWRAYMTLHRPRVVVVDADLVHEVGPRVAEAAARLFERLHAGSAPASLQSGPPR